MDRLTPTLAICCAAVVAAVGAAIFDLGGSESRPSVYGGSAAVTIQDFEFAPALVTPGIAVTFKNLDGAPHSATSDAAGVFDSGVVQGGTDGTFTAPPEPGDYPFHCSVHPSIHGNLVVATG